MNARRFTLQCNQCGELIESDVDSYAKHMKYRHSISEAPKVVPEKTTARTTPEIVRDIESGLKAFIILPTDAIAPEHSETCRCEACFNKQLDKMIAGEPITWGVNDEHVSAEG